MPFGEISSNKKKMTYLFLLFCFVSRKLIEVYIDLLNLLECPVCYKYASFNEAPIKICTEGHFICGSCGRGLETCPTCRGSFSNVRPTILHQVSCLFYFFIWLRLKQRFTIILRFFILFFYVIICLLFNVTLIS